MQYKMIMHLLFQQVTYLAGAFSLPGHMWWKTHLVMVVWTSAQWRLYTQSPASLLMDRSAVEDTSSFLYQA
jgi:hypothetical protein